MNIIKKVPDNNLTNGESLKIFNESIDDPSLSGLSVLARYNREGLFTIMGLPHTDFIEGIKKKPKLLNIGLYMEERPNKNSKEEIAKTFIKLGMNTPLILPLALII